MNMSSTNVTRSSRKYPPPPPRKRSIKTKPTKYNPTIFTMDNLPMSITSDVDHSDIDLDNKSLPKSAPVSPMIHHIPVNKPSQSLSPQSNTNPVIKFKNLPKSALNINIIPTDSYIDSSRPLYLNGIPSLKSVNRHKQRKLIKRRRKKRRKYKKKYSIDYSNYSSSESDNEFENINKRRHIKQASAPNLAHLTANNYRNDAQYKLRIVKDEKRKNKSKLRHMKSMNVIDNNKQKQKKKSKQRLQRNNTHSLGLTDLNNNRASRIKSVPLNIDDKCYWSNSNNNIQRKKIRSEKIHLYKKYPSAIST